MLKHQDNSQPQPPTQPAAQVRVTPEELAAAVTALQIRKEGAPGTIAIGDAVDELGLDATPEEVLAEVEARRRVAPKKRRITIWSYCLLALGLSGVLLGVRLAGVAVVNKFASIPPTAVTFPRAGSLAAVGNEQTAYIDTRGLKQIIGGTPEAQIRVYPHSEIIRWGLIKHDGQTYIQAYTPTTTERTMQAGTFNIFNFENADLNGSAKGLIYLGGGNYDTDVKITLPVRGFKCLDTQQLGQQAKVTITNAHTDDHLWDNFEHNH